MTTSPWKTTHRIDAKTFEDRASADVVASVLRGLDKVGQTFKVYEITGRNHFQIQVLDAEGQTQGWFVTCTAEEQLRAVLAEIEEKTKPGQELTLREAIDILCDVWNLSRTVVA